MGNNNGRKFTLLMLAILFSFCSPVLEKDGLNYINQLSRRYHCFEVMESSGETSNIYYKTEKKYFLNIAFRACAGKLSYSECNLDTLQIVAAYVYEKSKNKEIYSEVRVGCSTDSEDRKTQEIVFDVKNGKLVFKERNNYIVQ